ncbi:MAG: hypothetical protein R3Y49_06885 [Rikenellaceae bacterium]
MRKIVVKLCSGTMCYVMGGSELQILEELLPEEVAQRVEIRSVTCLDFCNSAKGGKAPFATVGDVIISSANNDTIIDEIKKQLRNNGN